MSFYYGSFHLSHHGKPHLQAQCSKRSSIFSSFIMEACSFSATPAMPDGHSNTGMGSFLPHPSLHCNSHRLPCLCFSATSSGAIHSPNFKPQCLQSHVHHLSFSLSHSPMLSLPLSINFDPVLKAQPLLFDLLTLFDLRQWRLPTASPTTMGRSFAIPRALLHDA